MTKKFLFSIFICLLGLSAGAQDAYITKNDIPYREKGDAYQTERCKLDIYAPSAGSGYPTVVWFHGGGLTSGSKFIPKQLMNCGYIVVAVNYRLLPKVKIDDCIDDAAAAIAWTFRNVEKYGGDTRKIFVSGHSAGGYLTTMTGLDKSRLKPYGIDPDSIAGLFPFSGQSICHFNYRKEKGMNDYQPYIDETAPMFHVRADAPTLIIVSGDRNLEMLGRYEENAYFWRMMKIAGHKETYIYELDGYDHGSMAEPAFHILKNHVKEIIESTKNIKP